jgi:hypothetical protein
VLPVPMDPLSEAVAAHLPPEVAGQLSAAARLVMAERGPKPSVTAWVSGVDLTVARIAFALSGDVAAAAQVIVTDPPDASPLAAKRRLKDLVAFSVSEDYFALRAALRRLNAPPLRGGAGAVAPGEAAAAVLQVVRSDIRPARAASPSRLRRIDLSTSWRGWDHFTIFADLM